MIPLTHSGSSTVKRFKEVRYVQNNQRLPQREEVLPLCIRDEQNVNENEPEVERQDWNQKNIYEIYNALNKADSYWLEMSYY